MKAWKAFAIASLAALVSSSALAQEMGGAMGPGADFGYEPGPGPGSGCSPRWAGGATGWHWSVSSRCGSRVPRRTAPPGGSVWVR